MHTLLATSRRRPSAAVARRSRRPLRARLAPLAALLTLAAVARPAHAQAWFYPSFQVPRVTNRDYTVGVSGNSGTSAIFQWREGLSPDAQFSLDAGLADGGRGVGTKVFLGGGYAMQIARAHPEQPLDLLFTAGAGVAVGDGPDVFRIPVGVSVGHRFPLEGGMAITPYVHPRLSLDVFTDVPKEADRTRLTIDFDVGAGFDITRQVAIRGSLLFSGADYADDVGFGIALTITPAGLRR